MNIGKVKTRPIPTATEFKFNDSNMQTQWNARRGPKVNPGFTSFFKLLFFLLINNKRKIEPTKVLIPTKPRELMSLVFTIKGIVPHSIEIAKIEI